MNKYENDLTHIRQMMERFILLLFLLFSENIISAQELTIGYSYTAIVKAKSGINMREAADATSKKILSIPYNSRITIVSYDTSYVAVIENIKGFWIHGKYNDEDGYVFSGFLEIQNCLDGIYFTIIADSILVDNDLFATSCEPYLGFYENKSDQFETEFTVKPVKMECVEAPDYWYENALKISADQQKPIFMFSGLAINKKSITGRLLKNEMLYPSETLSIGQNNDFYYIAYAKGNGIENDNKFPYEIFSKIENYKVWIRKIDKKTNLYSEYLIEEMTYGYSGLGLTFYWTGDLNDDNIPDIIYKASNHHAGWTCFLLLSQPESSKDLYKKVIIGGGSTC